MFALTPSSVSGLRVSRGAFPLPVLGFVALFSAGVIWLGDDAVLSRDNLKIAFKVHTVWRVDDRRIALFMERFSTTITDRGSESSPDAIVKVAYQNFVREPLRTFARDEVQRRNGLDVKGELVTIGDAVLTRIRAMRIIRGQLSSMYIQHEAIESQKNMVNSPNHTVVYIPVGPMGVPITATFPATQEALK